MYEYFESVIINIVSYSGFNALFNSAIWNSYSKSATVLNPLIITEADFSFTKSTSKPVKQGMFGIFEVFADTIVICTLTALVILVSGVPVNYGAAAGAELTISGFTSTYGGWVSIFTAVAMCCFAFSTIIGWGLYGARCIEFLFSAKVIRPFMIAYSLVAILGATVDLGLLWSIAETFNGLMSIPNLIGVFLLSGTAITLTKEYFAQKK